MQATSGSGQVLRNMFAAGTAWLEKNAADINAINVFPVPDGDTGTNMLLTMQATMGEADRVLNHDSVSAEVKAMAAGALLGARGNSGVILSQFWRGLANALEEKETFNGKDLAEALAEASRFAYKGLSNPVEGTILTVIRDAATAAEMAAQTNPEDLVFVLEASVTAARESVARTPLLLDVLREAGVVDAGGQGLYILLEGALYYLKGKMDEIQYRRPQLVATSTPLAPGAAQLAAEVEEPYGYCTNFLIKGQKLNPDKIRKTLEKKGQSLIVAGNESMVRVHIHTFDPGPIIRYVLSKGTLHEIAIQNMDDQYAEFVKMQRQRMPATDIATVAVVSGGGLMEVFRSLGVAAIVPGGQTMNPSVRELLEAVNSIPSDKVVLLPNNKNIVLTASQVQSLTPKKVKVVPTKTIPEGITALLNFSYEASLEENVKVMEEAIVTVKTVEITKAVRTTQIYGLKIKKGQAIAVVNDKELVAAGDNITEVLFSGLSKVKAEEAEMITIYYGADTEASQAEEVAEKTRSKYPKAQVEVVHGGQPHYNYIISLE